MYSDKNIYGAHEIGQHEDPDAKQYDYDGIQAASGRNGDDGPNNQNQMTSELVGLDDDGGRGGARQHVINSSAMYDDHELGVETDQGLKGKNGLRKRTVAVDENADYEEGPHSSPVNGAGEGQALLGEKKKPVERVPACYGLRRFLGWVISREKRTLHIDGTCRPRSYPTNKQNNQKYNIITLIPVVLFNQFKFFYNFFFLLIGLSQFIPSLKVGFMFTYIAPLVFVLTITIVKEEFDDIQRMRKDNDLNSKVYEKLAADGTFKKTTGANMKVGELIKVKQNERVPADMVLLYTTEKTGAVFIRTDQLDGETDWKLRKAVAATQSLTDPNDMTTLTEMNGEVVANPPNDQIYDFKGVFESYNTVRRRGSKKKKEDLLGAAHTGVEDSKKEALSLENTMWANTVLASSGYAIGMIVYAGSESRAQMNSKQALTKVGKLDLEINRLSKLLFILMIVLSLGIVALQEFKGNWVINFFRFILLLSAIIPISLRVNLDMGKVYYCLGIYTDENIPGTIPRNSTIPEELGRVQFLLTDKTGTLTQNDMIFKKLNMEYAAFDTDTLTDLQAMLRQNCEENRGSGPMADLVQRKGGPAGDDELNNLDAQTPGPVPNTPAKSKKKGGLRRDLSYLVRDLITALALCHNVTPTYPDENDKTQVEYQASSPDEVALVKFAESLEMRLYERDQKNITIVAPTGDEETYEILANFPFSSDTKRMGIIMKHEKTGRMIFYLKGAETVMKEKVKPNQRVVIDESCDNLANEGLRTLVIAQKSLSSEYYTAWQQRYEAAKADLNDRERRVRACIDELEDNMELLGVTGVEDKLQDEVALVIESLRNAGIQVWMLTGDKVETATCIAISAGFKRRTQPIYFIRDVIDPDEVNSQLDSYARKAEQSILMIDGISLDLILADKKLEEKFFREATKSPSVCVCRCSPTQKAIITKKIAQYTGKRTAAIGDGGNDVGMILEANVGIGIVGKEGKQASLAADFSIDQFKYLRRLVLWHGRLSYKRSAVLSQFVIHRGLVITIIQAIFSIIFYFVAIPIYNGYLILGYSTVYTMFPVFSLVTDEDVTDTAVIKFPILYSSLQKGRVLSTKTFLIWMWKSVFQGCVIMLGSVIVFPDSFTNIVTITFSSLIVCEILNVFSEVHKVNYKMIISSVLTLMIYFMSIALLRSYFDVSYIDWPFVLKVIAITLASWAPLHIVRRIYDCIDPSEHQKIMRQNH